VTTSPDHATIPPTMSAAVHAGYGDADVIRVDQAPVPTSVTARRAMRMASIGGLGVTEGFHYFLAP